MQHRDRIEALRAKLPSLGVDAAASLPGSTFRYLTGGNFALMERPTVLFVPAGGGLVAILPEIEVETWGHLGIAADIVSWRDEQGFADAFRQAAGKLKLRRLGIEAFGLRFVEATALRNAFADLELVDIQSTTGALRAVKDADEIALLRRAVAYSEAGFAKAMAAVRVGMTELELQRLLMQRLLDEPISGNLVAPLVLTGAKSALPHGQADDTPIRAGDALLVDFGVVVGGYTADLTRTVFVREVSDADRAFYGAVKAASDHGLSVARPGITAGDLDNEVRGHLEKGPFAAFVLHKTGHGIGLDVHEAPQLMRGNAMLLAPGHVIAVEPGLYRSGAIGVRIEDNLLITPDGAERLSQSSRDLSIVG